LKSTGKLCCFAGTDLQKRFNMDSRSLKSIQPDIIVGSNFSGRRREIGPGFPSPLASRNRTSLQFPRIKPILAQALGHLFLRREVTSQSSHAKNIEAGFDHEPGPCLLRVSGLNRSRGRALGRAAWSAQAEPADATDGNEPHPCPHCGGRMIIIETFERGSMPRHRPKGPTIAIRIDTS
jgi:hypothetical protein